jgi:hypothetical protein
MREWAGNYSFLPPAYSDNQKLPIAVLLGVFCHGVVCVQQLANKRRRIAGKRAG